MSRTTNIRKLAVMALLVAVSVVLIYAVRFPLIPAAAFLEYDPADIPILILYLFIHTESQIITIIHILFHLLTILA